MSAIDTLLVRDGATLVGVVCDESRRLAASGDICPVCGKPTRYAPDVLDELAAAVGADRGGRGAGSADRPAGSQARELLRRLGQPVRTNGS
jgi:hypothetical protein